MDTSSQNTSIFELAASLWRRRKGIALLAFSVAFAAVVSLVWALPDFYRASATVLVHQDGDSGAAIQSSSSGELELRLHAVGQEILSRTRLQRLIDRFDLYSGIRKEASAEAVIERMRKDIRLERKEIQQNWGRGTTVAFVLSYQGWDPKTVAGVTNTLASLYVEENEQIRQRDAENTAALVKEQLEDVKRKLERQEQKIGGFKDRYLGELPEQQEANLATLERFNSQLRLNSESQIRVMSRREKLLEKDSDPAAAGAGGGSGEIESRLSRLQQELAELRTRYSDKYPDVVRLASEISALKRQLAEARVEAGGSGPADSRREKIAAANAEIAALEKEETRLRGAITEYQQRIENAPRREQELQKLTRDYNAIRDLYSTLLKRYEEAQLGESLERRKAEQFRILDPAVAPKDPVGPDRIRLILMGFILSWALAGGLVFLAEQLDNSFHSATELRRFTRVPVLATVPRIVTRGDAWRRRFGLCFVTVLAAAVLVLVARGSYLLGQGNEQLVWMIVQRGA